MNRDYTKEIIRCSKFIVNQMIRGIEVKDAILQAEQSYGYAITLNSQRALLRNLNK